MRSIFKNIHRRIYIFKMRYFWLNAIMTVKDGMKVQLELYEGRRNWEQEKGNTAEAQKADVAVRVLNYWLREIENVLNGHFPGEKTNN